MVKRALVAASLALALAACQDDGFDRSSRHLSPIPPATLAAMSEKGMSRSDPILIRSYKKESELEIWKKGKDGRYALLKTYPICRWSGQLGPKVREGDRQAPEGFYTVTPAQMNPNSSYHLSFDTGYPNAFDRAHGRTGSHLMVHGSCSSRGCFAMTDQAITEVYAIAREAFNGGQRGFQFQSYPFRMTAQNLAKHRKDPHIAYWRNLKEGADHFEVTGEEPKVAVCGKRYAFNTAGDCGAPDAALVAAVAEKQARDDQQVADLVAKGAPALRLVYEDGGGHPSFRDVAVASSAESDGFPIIAARSRRDLGDVSRPEALAMGPRAIVLDEAGKPLVDKPVADKPVADAKPATALAFAGAEAVPAALPRAELPKPRADAPPAAKAKVEAARMEVAKTDPAKTEAAKADAGKTDAAKTDAGKVETARVGAREEPVRVAAATPEAPAPKPLYARMMGGITGLFGGGTADAASPAAAAPAAEPSPAPPARPKATTRLPADKPLPDRRAGGPAPQGPVAQVN